MTGTSQNPIAVLGAGSWGTALAILLANNGFQTRLWAHNSQHVADMIAARCNKRFIPDVPFPSTLQPEAELGQVVQQAQDILVVVPSHGFRATLKAIAPHLTSQHRLAWGTKGLEPGSRKFVHQIVNEELGESLSSAVISGPTFASEVAHGQPGAVTVASKDQGFAQHLAEVLHNDFFRAYTSNDVIGVEVGGAIKNVLAIAAGIADGLGFGANSRAALIARGLAEIIRLGVSLGGQRETFTGLTGLGDLVLTCTDNQSRNRRMGLALGKGQSKEDAMAAIGQVVEGVNTAKEVFALAQENGVEMPICEQVYRVLHEGRDPSDAVHALMERAIKAETAD